MIPDHVARLKADLKNFEAMSASLVEEKVSAAGFRCRRCAKCCSGRYGDNTVTIFPSEIRSVMASTGLGWLDIARPHESVDVDDMGFIRTFEWVLRKKKNGDCAFLEGGKCTIYACRPLICRTYPMRLEAEALELYECDGLGAGTTDNAPQMADALIKRQISETSEAIALLEKYGAYKPEKGHAASGKVYVVHDSEGSHIVVERSDGSFSF